MENGWSFFHNTNSSNNSTSGSRGQNRHCTNIAWDIFDLGATRVDWSSTIAPNNHNNSNLFHQEDPPLSTAVAAEARAVHELMLAHNAHPAASLYGPRYQPDPHLMCLKLGKRHYFEDAGAAPPMEDRLVDGMTVVKRGRPYYGGVVGGTSAAAAVLPRCQVEGCQVALVTAKEYHRRHKVCEMHSKAPRVVVLGLEQRFCQQCSRFHAVSEFDESKRSCRRRLAGHNERRRKGSHDSTSRNPSQENNNMMAEKFPDLTLPTGRALSLLSSKNDLSSRCSAALRELIVENRASILSRQLVQLNGQRHHHSHHHVMEGMSNFQATTSHQMFPEPQGWDRFNENGGHVTLDLMQAPSSAFGFLSVRGKSKEEEEEEEACSDELWSSFGGANVV